MWGTWASRAPRRWQGCRARRRGGKGGLRRAGPAPLSFGSCHPQFCRRVPPFPGQPDVSTGRPWGPGGGPLGAGSPGRWQPGALCCRGPRAGPQDPLRTLTSPKDAPGAPSAAQRVPDPLGIGYPPPPPLTWREEDCSAAGGGLERGGGGAWERRGGGVREGRFGHRATGTRAVLNAKKKKKIPSRTR